LKGFVLGESGRGLTLICRVYDLKVSLLSTLEGERSWSSTYVEFGRSKKA